MKNNEFKVGDKVRVLGKSDGNVFISSAKIIKLKMIAIVKDEFGFNYAIPVEQMYKIGKNNEAIF